jgi:cell division protein FtsB
VVPTGVRIPNDMWPQRFAAQLRSLGSVVRSADLNSAFADRRFSIVSAVADYVGTLKVDDARLCSLMALHIARGGDTDTWTASTTQRLVLQKAEEFIESADDALDLLIVAALKDQATARSERAEETKVQAAKVQRLEDAHRKELVKRDREVVAAKGERDQLHSETCSLIAKVEELEQELLRRPKEPAVKPRARENGKAVV